MSGTTDITYRSQHVLVGLEHTMSPEDARQKMLDGVSGCMSSKQIKSTLRLAATVIYNHEQLSPRLRTRDGADIIAYFLCATYGKDAPSPGETLSLSFHGNCQPFKLSHWDSLYYALLVEIRLIYTEIEQYFDTEFQSGALVLHTYGWDTTQANSPLTSLDLTSRLEELWILLMDPSLIGPLDEAVRMEQWAEQLRGHYSADEFRTKLHEMWNQQMSELDKAKAIDEATGMVNIHQMRATEVIDMLWQQQMPLLRRACLENFQRDIQFKVRLAAYRLHPHIQDIPLEQLESTLCTCDTECQCKLVCQFEVSPCACKESQNNQRRSIWWGEKVQESVREGPEPSAMRQMLGATTSGMAQLQIVGMANHNSQTAQTSQFTDGIMHQDETQPARSQPRKSRSNTNQSELAYVPGPKTPGRGRKDAYPLDFYNSSPGGRYPQFSSEGAIHPQPIYGASCYSTSIPSRKPLQNRLSIVTQTHASASTNTSPSSPLGRFEDTPANSPTGSVFYPEIPKSTSKIASLTQSFPVVAAGNPRQPENEFADWSSPGPASPEDLTMSDFFAAEVPQSRQPPTTRHSVDYSQTRSCRKEVEATPLDPRLPTAYQGLPDFIAPRPAVMQRYVSAGGNAKLCERSELPGFALPPCSTRGATMSKEDVLRRLEEQQAPGYRRDSAIAMNHRYQTQEGVATMALSHSQRSSGDIDEIVRGEKRGRTGSTSSLRKLKRVFSRQNSQSE